MSEARLFDESTLRKLESLALIAHKVRVGAMKGDRRSSKHGTSIEFADYRDYSPGDDLRRLDWNVYARLERPFIKLLEEEEDLTVHLLIDASASMDWPKEGADGGHKLSYALRLAGALGYIGLTGGDRVAAASLAGARMDSRWGPSRTRSQALPFFDYLGGIRAGAVTDLSASLVDYALKGGRPGLAILLSDMFSSNGYLPGLDALLSRGYEVAVLHLLSPDEIAPELSGDLRLIDSETGDAREASFDPALRRMYVKRLEEWRQTIGADCLRRGVHYVPISTEMPWETIILNTLRHAGVIS